MAFPAETVTSTLVGLSHVIFKINGSEIGRVTEVGDIATGDTLYKHLGHNADGSSQVVKLFILEKGNGEVDLTLDEVLDVDGAAVNGEKITITLEGVYQKDTAHKWSYSAAKAYVVATGFKANRGATSTCKVHVTPYNDPGTPAWAFNNVASS